MNKPTEQEFQQALKVLRAYDPVKFLNVKVVEHIHSTPEGFCVVRDKGYYHLVSPTTGEIVTMNIFLRITDSSDDAFSAIGKFLVQQGEVIP